MPTESMPNSPLSSRRLTAILDVLLQFAQELGTVKEAVRLTETRLDRHGQRLASAEANITSLQQATSTSNPSTPSRPMPPPPRMTPISPPSMDTSTAPTLLQRAFRAFSKEALKDIAIWLAQKAGGLLLPYILPGALAALAYLTPFGRALWRLILG